MKKVLALVCVMLLLVGCVGLAGCDVRKRTDEEREALEKTVTIGYTIYEPMNYKDADGNLIGFDTELAQAVFSKMGYTVVFKEIKWENKYTDLDAGVIDCIWNGFTCNAADNDGVQRADKVDFSYRYMENAQAVVVKKDSGITDAAALNGKIGAAEAGSAGESYMKGFAGAANKGVLKQTDALMEVNAGTADFAVVDVQLARSYCGKGGYANLTYIEALTSDVEYYAIGFKKGSELTAQVNAQLEALAADGTITALAKKYNVENTAIIDYASQKAAG